MVTQETRSAAAEDRAITIDGWRFIKQRPDWQPGTGSVRVGRFGQYVDWAGIVDKIVRKLTGPNKTPVVLRGVNGCGKDALAAEVACRLAQPYYVTVLEPDVTASSLICFPLLPLEAKVYALSSHLTAAVTGGTSCITECGKGDHRWAKVLTPLLTAYDEHFSVKANQPPVAFQVHPDHALLILALPGEEIQYDMTSRAANYTLPQPPPEVLMEIARMKVRGASSMLLGALREVVSEHHAAERPMPPRAAITTLRIAVSDCASAQPSAREARGLIETAMECVAF